MWSADGDPGPGHSLATRVRNREGNTEIRNERTFIEKQNVPGIDIAMDDTVPVCMLEGIGYVDCNSYRVIDRKLSLAIQSLAQCLSLYILHHVEDQSICRAEIEQRENVRMLKIRGELDFLQETVGARDR